MQMEHVMKMQLRKVNKMKRIFSLLAVLLLLVGVFGCAQKTTEETSTSTEESTSYSSSTEDMSTATDEASDDSDLEVTSEEDELGEPI